MRAIVEGEVAAGKDDALPLITTTMAEDHEGIAEAAGRRWRFMLDDDGAGGTTATVTGQEAASWAG